MDDPWEHVPPLEASPRRLRPRLSDETVRLLLVVSAVVLALMPIIVPVLVLFGPQLW